MASRIDQKTPASTIEAGDILYSLRGNQDLSLDAHTAIPALVGIAAGKAFTFDGTTGARVEMDGLVASDFKGLETTWVSTTSFSVATGFIGDSTSVDILALRSALTKTTASWAVGTAAGGLDSGAIANNTWYAAYVIKRIDTGVVDVIFSTSATSPTLPTNYTLFRRVAWVRTDGSAQFRKWFQRGRQFLWDAKVSELNEINPASTNRILLTVTTPINVEGIFSLSYSRAVVQHLDVGWTQLSDVAPSLTNFVLGTSPSSSRQTGVLRFQVDSSRQIYYRSGDTTATLSLLTDGWIDNP